ncbi:MAG: glutathione reductase (NADPH) [Candidatus Tokpelaia sp. JSC161]|nr:MAG: glutathione reductase (NADPH) [Candidatus Tokpelaia sp. JSC161]
MLTYDYDLFVIGAGSAGIRAARLAGDLGRRVAIAEENRLGGTCVIRGCVPKKIFTYASSYSEVFEDARGFGWSVENPSFSWDQLMSSQKNEISRLETFYSEGLKKSKVSIYKDRAVFIDEHTLELVFTGERVTAEKILIATGACPKRYDFPGKDLCISSDDIFHLQSLPQSMLIVGSGYIAVEFANIFHGFGVNTTLVSRGDFILRRFDEDLRSQLQDAMRMKGIGIISNSLIHSVEKKNKQLLVFLSHGKEFLVDKVLLALGRVPKTEALALDKAKVSTDIAGRVLVDSYMRTHVRHIWAIGDVTNRMQLTPVAIHEAMCFVKTVFEGIPTSPDYNVIPTAVFSQPEVASVGLSEEKAVQKFHHVEIYRAHFLPMRHVVSGRKERCFMKLVVHGDSRILLGAHILGQNASELIQILAIALKGSLTKDVLDATMALHPTAAEELVTMYNASYRYSYGKKTE